MKNLTLKSLNQLYQLPLFELIERAHDTLNKYQAKGIQKCSLLSIKTGSCPEDCSYCPQSAHYKTDVTKNDLMSLDEVKSSIKNAQELGAKRFCMGAAWREVKDGEQFDLVLAMVKEIKKAGMEACVTLGMLNLDQANKLKAAGLDAYNHNLDSGPNFYDKVITTRTYQDRLNTIDNVQKAHISVCSGGIIGMGESLQDRLEMLLELAQLDTPPESIPLNLLIPVAGTPLADLPPVDPIELVKLIAVTRIAFPNSKVRLSAGRKNLSQEAQVLCYYSGANSIFLGEKLLTMDNPSIQQDNEILKML